MYLAASVLHSYLGSESPSRTNSGRQFEISSDVGPQFWAVTRKSVTSVGTKITLSTRVLCGVVSYGELPMRR